MNLKKSIFVTALFLSFSISSFAFAMEEDDQHPGGLFKRNIADAQEMWSPQCQGCNKWLLRYSLPYKPTDQNVSYTDLKAKMNHVYCSYMSSQAMTSEEGQALQSPTCPKETIHSTALKAAEAATKRMLEKQNEDKMNYNLSQKHYEERWTYGNHNSGHVVCAECEKYVLADVWDDNYHRWWNDAMKRQCYPEIAPKLQDFKWKWVHLSNEKYGDPVPKEWHKSSPIVESDEFECCCSIQ